MDSVPKMKSVLREYVFLKNPRPHLLLVAKINVKMLTKSVLMGNAGTSVKSTIYALASPLKIARDINTAILVIVVIQEDVSVTAPVTKD